MIIKTGGKCMKNNLNTKIEFEKNRSEIAHYIYHQDDINLNFESHLHFSFEILYVEEGQLEATIDNRFFSINSHQAIIIFPNQIHCYRTKQYSKSQASYLSKRPLRVSRI